LNNVASTTQYVCFFARRGKLFSLFGEPILAYALVLLGVSGLLVLFDNTSLSGGASGADMPPLIRSASIACFLLVHCVALSATVSAHLTVAHVEYLEYLGFTDQQTRFLACIVAAPLCFAGSVFVCLVITNGLPLGWRFGILIATFVIGELASPILLGVRNRWGYNAKDGEGKRYGALRLFAPFEDLTERSLKKTFENCVRLMVPSPLFVSW
jgi:hypothetical protein